MKFSDFMIPANEAVSNAAHGENVVTVKWGNSKVSIKSPISKSDINNTRKYKPTVGVDDFNVKLIQADDLAYVFDNWDAIIKMIERSYQAQFKTNERLTNIVIPCRIDYDWSRMPDKGAILIVFMARSQQYTISAYITRNKCIELKMYEIIV